MESSKEQQKIIKGTTYNRVGRSDEWLKGREHAIQFVKRLHWWQRLFKWFY
jgi:hypothetical protein